jgi:hypothetical protein
MQSIAKAYLQIMMNNRRTAFVQMIHSLSQLLSINDLRPFRYLRIANVIGSKDVQQRVLHEFGYHDLNISSSTSKYAIYNQAIVDERGAFTNNAQSITASPVSRCNAAAWKSPAGQYLTEKFISKTRYNSPTSRQS